MVVGVVVVALGGVEVVRLHCGVGGVVDWMVCLWWGGGVGTVFVVGVVG